MANPKIALALSRRSHFRLLYRIAYWNRPFWGCADHGHRDFLDTFQQSELQVQPIASRIRRIVHIGRSRLGRNFFLQELKPHISKTFIDVVCYQGLSFRPDLDPKTSWNDILNDQWKVLAATMRVKRSSRFGIEAAGSQSAISLR